MTRFSGKERRPSTIIRDNGVHEAYEDVCREIGDMAKLLPKEYLYEKVKARTGLCTKTIAWILNNPFKKKLTMGGGKISPPFFCLGRARRTGRAGKSDRGGMLPENRK